MQPVAILQFSPLVGPGHFSDYLDANGIAQTLIRVDRGEAVPASPSPFSGLCLLGGPMSANDELDWTGPVLNLIRSAGQRGIPLLGLCLGGQLIARALGGQVRRNPVPEIGWQELEATDPASSWLSGIERFPAFEWHGETFSLPEGAHPLLASRWCAHQAFALGPHLALQFHPEITPAIATAWLDEWHAKQVQQASADGPVQTRAAIEDGLDSKLAAMRCAADHLFSRWSEGLTSAQA